MESKSQHFKSAALGKKAEEAVCIAMTRKGFREVARNYSVNRLGELDLVFLKDNTIYIVEVRLRKKGGNYGDPEDSIGPMKKKRVYSTAKYFIADFGLHDYDVCFLAACVRFSPEQKRFNICITPF